jgi:hypothetical protein
MTYNSKGLVSARRITQKEIPVLLKGAPNKPIRVIGDVFVHLLHERKPKPYGHTYNKEIFDSGLTLHGPIIP